MNKTSAWTTIGLGLLLPVLLIALILGADTAEGPKTAYVGVLAVVPMLAAVFATPRMTLLVAAVTWLSALIFGHLASDGNVAAQQVRLIIIAMVGLAAVGAAHLRLRRERQLVLALRDAAAAEVLREQAETDQLTELLNRHGLLNAVAGFDDDSTRTIAIVDCDGLKAVNDDLGHLSGDEYLRAVAGRIVGSVPKVDLVARWGGDEFLILQRLDVDAAMPALNRMWRAVGSSPISLSGTMVDASVSVGVTSWPPGMTFDEALSAADRAMYEAKSEGGNRIVTSA